MRTQARLLALLAVALLALVVTQAVPSATPADSADLRDAVTVGAIRDHQQAFQGIANANGGVRTAGTAGYDASLAYVKAQLDATGYFTTSMQPFEFPYFEETAPAEFEQISPNAVTYALDDDFATMSYSGSGNVEGTLVATNDIVIPPGPVASTSNSGCELSDFVPASVAQPQVALIQRGTCDFSVKAANAEEAGYDAVVIFNEGTDNQPDRQTTLFGTLSSPDATTLPVIGTSFAVGEDLFELLDDGPVVVRVETTTTSEIRTTNT
jgi:Zn-dependent M28 family amino/carboxypeptidase